jgi:hypothetical protein
MGTYNINPFAASAVDWVLCPVAGAHTSRIKVKSKRTREGRGDAECNLFPMAMKGKCFFIGALSITVPDLFLMMELGVKLKFSK